MSAKTQFFNFLNNAIVDDNDLVSHTWMFGDEEFKPKKGKFFISDYYSKEFRNLYTKAVLEGVEIKLSEKPYGDKCRMFLDVDGSQQINNIISDLSIFMQDNFITFENIKFIPVQNSLKKDKYHVHIFQKDEASGKLSPISIKKYYMELITKHLKEKYKEVDFTKSLRMLYSAKKDGLDKGIYAPDEKITTKIMKLYSIISDIEDRCLSPTFEFQEQAIQNIEASLKMKDEKAVIEFTDENNVERLHFILPILQKNGYLDEFESWFALTVICKKYGFPPEDIDSLCSISENYVSGCVDTIYQDNNTSLGNKKGYTIATAQYYLSKCDPDAYAKYKSQFFKAKDGGEWLPLTVLTEMWNEELGHSRVYLELVEDNVVLVDSTKWHGYIWDDVSKLWAPSTKEGVYLHIANTLENIAKIMVTNQKNESIKLSNQMKETSKDSEEGIKLAINYKISVSREKAVQGILKCTRTKRHATNVFEFAKHKLFNIDFTKVINNSKFLFPIKGGLVVNLKTKDTRTREKSDLFSYESNVNIGDKNNAKVLRFFSEIMSEKEDRIKFLQQVLGYCLGGDTKAKRFFVLIGKGSNSKSVVTNIMNKIMGKYSSIISTSIFVKPGRGADRHASKLTPELVPLSTGCRLAYCSEIGRDSTLNDTLLKTLTGDDPVDCNPKGGAVYSFEMYAKLMVLTNYTPEFVSTDVATLERFTNIHFEETFAVHPKKGERQRDTAFVEDLIKNHIDDIFAWLLDGSISYWEKVAFDVPEQFQKNKDELEDAHDDIGDFLTTNITRKIECSVQVLHLYKSYTSWCRDSNIEPFMRKSFISEILNRGFTKGKNSKNCIVINGMMLQEEEDVFQGFN